MLNWCKFYFILLSILSRIRWICHSALDIVGLATQRDILEEVRYITTSTEGDGTNEVYEAKDLANQYGKKMRNTGRNRIVKLKECKPID